MKRIALTIFFAVLMLILLTFDVLADIAPEPYEAPIEEASTWPFIVLAGVLVTLAVVIILLIRRKAKYNAEKTAENKDK